MDDCAPPPDVLLLAAGLGTRMRPLTLTTPKALIPVAGKPLIEYGIAAARAEGVTRFVVNAHHKAEQIKAHVATLGAAFPELRFAVSDEGARLLETGGGLRAALPLLGTDPVLVLNADSFWLPGGDTPIRRMIAAYRRGGADLVLLCIESDRAAGLRKDADFFLSRDGTLSHAAGRPVIYCGAALVSRALAAEGPDTPFSLARHFETAREKTRLRGVMIAAPWFHVGDLTAVARTSRALGAAV